MRRYRVHEMTQWLHHQRRKPLVLRGARQVGKSTLVRLFAQQEGLRLAEINLEQQRYLDQVFATCDLNKILPELRALTRDDLREGALLFLDEIQATPHALAALRYFYERMPELPVVAAGSLLEFALADHSFSMPVGRVTYMHLGPMSFEEFLQAVDAGALSELHDFDPDQPMAQASHERLLAHQRAYLLCGGMPEAVDTYRVTRSLAEAQAALDGIADTYRDDFAKYAKQKDLADLQHLFRSAPAMIGTKAVYARLLPGARSSHTRPLLDLLIKALLISPVDRSDCNGIPLAAEADPGFRKLLMLDVGLVARQLGLDSIDLHRQDEVRLVNEGPLAEQFIGQHLTWSGPGRRTPELYYWAREGRNSNAEVDFVLARGELIVPVEVKAGRSGTLKSLHQFMCEKSLSYAIRFDLNPPSRQQIDTTVMTSSGKTSVSYELINLPLYAVERLPTILDVLRAR